MLTCSTCHTVCADESAAYCGRCGTALKAPASAIARPAARWYHNIWFALAMLFLVLGPFGLPLVWSNPRFARWAKWTLTIVMVGYTVGLIKVTIQMVQAVSQTIHQFNSTL